MTSTYSTSLRLELQADGENSGTWGQKTNTNLGTLLEQAIAGWTTINPSGNTTLTTNNGVSDQSRYAMIKIGASGAPVGAYSITIPSVSKAYLFDNQSGQTATIQTAVAGAGAVAIPNAYRMLVYSDGTNVTGQFNASAGGFSVFGGLGVTGSSVISGGLTLGGALTAVGAVNFAVPVTIPSTSTTDIFATASNSAIVTGNAAIVSLGNAGGAFNGAIRTVVFNGTPLLTNSATLILPGGVNLQTVAGDAAVFLAVAGGVECIGYQPNAAIVRTGTSGATLGLLNGNNTHSGLETFNGAMAVKQAYQSGGIVTVTPSGGSVTMDFALGSHFVATLNGAGLSVPNPLNQQSGQSGALMAIGPANAVVTFGSNWHSANGVRPTASAGGSDILFWWVYTPGYVYFTYASNVS